MKLNNVYEISYWKWSYGVRDMAIRVACFREATNLAGLIERIIYYKSTGAGKRVEGFCDMCGRDGERSRFNLPTLLKF